MRRMFSRSLPSHGGIVTFGSAEPWIGGSVTVGSGVPLSAGGSVAVRGARRRRLHAHLVARDEDAAAEQVERGEVVAGDDDVAAGHDEDDRQEPGDRQRVEDDPRPPEPPAAAQRDSVQVHRHPVGIDDRQQAVEQRDEVQDEDAGQDPRREEEPEQLCLVRPEHHAGEQGEQPESAAPRSPGRDGRRRRRHGPARERRGRGQPRRTATAHAGAPPAEIASRVGYSDARSR